MKRIACIVEGHGDVLAAPVLVRRIALELGCSFVDIPTPIRIKKGRLLQMGQLERAVELAARRTSREDAILVILDADDDCPAELGPELLERARRARSDRRIYVVIAKSEFESWFIAAARSIAGHRGLELELDIPDDPEAIGDAKGWLSRSSAPGKSYRETLDQPALSQVLSLDEARRSPSFDKLWRSLEEALSEGAQ